MRPRVGRKGIYAERELEAGATIRKFRIVRIEGKREVAPELEHYNLDAILADHAGADFCRAGEGEGGTGIRTLSGVCRFAAASR